MIEFDKIYLSWRRGQGIERHIVGFLEKHLDGTFKFQYDLTKVEQAKQEGFSPYTEFVDLTKTYNGNVLDIFAQRLTKAERTDVQGFYDFWEIEPKFIQDKFYLLGHTQGLLPTDNFEFLADYKPVPTLHFLTDLAHVAEKKIPAGAFVVNDKLRYELDRENSHYDFAVKVFKGDKKIGFIKKIHSKVFYSSKQELKLTVKAVDQNGYIKRLFVKVSY